MIWLSARSHDEAVHICRTHVHALGLVRMKRKYGVRVLAEHEEQTFKQIKPDATWVNAQVQRVFQLFRLPHGLQRGGVLKLLKDVGCQTPSAKEGSAVQCHGKLALPHRLQAISSLVLGRRFSSPRFT